MKKKHFILSILVFMGVLLIINPPVFGQQQYVMKFGLAGAPDTVPNFTQVMPLDDNFATIATGIEFLGGDSWMLRLEYDRNLASSWDSDSYFAKVMFNM